MFHHRIEAMLFDWRQQPALDMPGLAYTMLQPNATWQRVSPTLVSKEGRDLDESEFWARFSAWNLLPTPAGFPRLAAAFLAQQQKRQQQQQPRRQQTRPRRRTRV